MRSIALWHARTNDRLQALEQADEVSGAVQSSMQQVAEQASFAVLRSTTEQMVALEEQIGSLKESFEGKFEALQETVKIDAHSSDPNTQLSSKASNQASEKSDEESQTTKSIMHLDGLVQMLGDQLDVLHSQEVIRASSDISVRDRLDKFQAQLKPLVEKFAATGAGQIDSLSVLEFKIALLLSVLLL